MSGFSNFSFEDVKAITPRLFRQDMVFAVIEVLHPFRQMLDTDKSLSFMLADSLRRVGRLSESIAVLISSPNSSLEGLSFDQLICLGEARKELGEYSWSVDCYVQAKCLSGNQIPGWLHVLHAAALLRQEKFFDAIEVLNEALLSDDVDIDEVQLNLSFAYRAIGDRERSVKCALSVVNYSPPSDLATEAKNVLQSLKAADEVL